MLKQCGKDHLISRLILLLAMGLAVSLTIAFAATYRGKQTGGSFGVFPQDDGGEWYVQVRTGPGFSRYEAVHSRDTYSGGYDSVQVYNKNHIVTLKSGDRSQLRIFGAWGGPPVLPSRIASRLDPAPVEPAYMTEEDLKSGNTLPKKDWRSYFETLEAGWPIRCLRAEVVGPRIDYTYLMESEYRGAVRLPDLTNGLPDDYFVFGRLQGAIPYHPMPFGLAVNTLFWAFVFWIIFLLPWQLRRWSRVRNGRCLACGYDLSGAVSDICPECGNERAVQPT